MPEIIRRHHFQLADANVTVASTGRTGIGQLLAGLAGQAAQLMKLVQNSVNTPEFGQRPADPAPRRGGPVMGCI